MRNLKYKPTSHNGSSGKREDDVAEMRAYYFSNAPYNLKFLLEKRFGWMNKYIKNEDTGVELGCGTGLSKLFIKCRNYKITDLSNHDWLDEKNIDALNTPYADESLDFVIASNLIHVLPYPVKFFREMQRILKPNGVVIMHEINASWSMRKIARILKKEGYDFSVNVFDENRISTDSEDLSAGNSAIPNLLFDNEKEFEKNIPFFKIEYAGFSEFMLLINSGGVATQTRYLRLPKFLLRLVNKVDKVLVKIAPSTFALQRQVVLRKK